MVNHPNRGRKSQEPAWTMDQHAERLVSIYRRYGQGAAQNAVDCLVAGGLKVFELAVLQDEFKARLKNLTPAQLRAIPNG